MNCQKLSLSLLLQKQQKNRSHITMSSNNDNAASNDIILHDVNDDIVSVGNGNDDGKLSEIVHFLKRGATHETRLLLPPSIPID